jgi:hypothetical protein
VKRQNLVFTVSDKAWDGAFKLNASRPIEASRPDAMTDFLKQVLAG